MTGVKEKVPREIAGGDSQKKEVSSKEGYTLWADFYDSEKNPLVALEECYADKLLEKLACSHVLDAGTGTGRYALKMARRGVQVTALDNCKEMLSVAKAAALKENLAIEFRISSLENPLQFEDSRFDTVVCSLVLSHVQTFERIFQDFYRVLKKGGNLLVTDLHPDCIADGGRTEFCKNGTLYLLPNKNRSREDYLNAVKAAGFKLVKVIDAKVREVPKDYLPEEVIRELWGKNLCLLILAKKP